MCPVSRRNPAKGYRLGKVERDESSSEFMHDSYIDAAPTAKIRYDPRAQGKDLCYRTVSKLI